MLAKIVLYFLSSSLWWNIFEQNGIVWGPAIFVLGHTGYKKKNTTQLFIRWGEYIKVRAKGCLSRGEKILKEKSSKISDLIFSHATIDYAKEMLWSPETNLEDFLEQRRMLWKADIPQQSKWEKNLLEATGLSRGPVTAPDIFSLIISQLSYLMDLRSGR